MATDDALTRPATADIPIVQAQGDLDIANLEPLANRLRAAAASSPVVILDARDITFGDSSFLGVLITVNKSTDLRIAGARPTLRRLIEIVGMGTVLSLYHSVDEARSAPPREPSRSW
ncbi:STAS domain-containing protein [Streptomyces sp. V4-01]|uniref:STAS domain-containing protein n=1 Tax=Actinacidiphila polyblastidii TaxID=3110430 RepID=A0ABU7P435_9ACTN|nr:STAS domain-containing protein [Streptomyces sp. V4-01]